MTVLMCAHFMVVDLSSVSAAIVTSTLPLFNTSDTATDSMSSEPFAITNKAFAMIIPFTI
jgi:hypothetical protein